MTDHKEWSGEERRKILDRRKKERARAALGLPEKGGADRRKQQICFVCHESFMPSQTGQVVCSQCADDGIRGGAHNRARY
jgi:hypothetical protein